MAALDKAMERAQKSQRDAASGQHGLFGMFDSGPAASTEKEEALPAAPEWDEYTRLAQEKEVLGFFVSGHPLDKYRDKLRNLKGVIDTQTACEMKPEPVVFTAGQGRAAERDPGSRCDYRVEGGEIEAVRRDVCAGLPGRRDGQD